MAVVSCVCRNLLDSIAPSCVHGYDACVCRESVGPSVTDQTGSYLPISKSASSLDGREYRIVA